MSRLAPIPLPSVSLPASLLEINDALVPPLTFEEELTLAKLASEATRPSDFSAGVSTDNNVLVQGGLGSILGPVFSLPGLEPLADLAAVRIASGPYVGVVLDTVLQPAIRDALKSSALAGGAVTRDGDPRARLAIGTLSESLRAKAEGRIRRAGTLARRD